MFDHWRSWYRLGIVAWLCLCFVPTFAQASTDCGGKQPVNFSEYFTEGRDDVVSISAHPVDEVLVIKAGDYDLGGRGLDLVAGDICLLGPITIRSFSEGTRPVVVPGVPATAKPGANGWTDGQHGTNGSQGTTGTPGAPGKDGAHAGRISLTVFGTVFGPGRLTIDNSGMQGGQGQRGGTGGVGGTGGHGRNRECPLFGGGRPPGNGGVGGQGGLGGTGGSGGQGGDGGAIVYSASLDNWIAEGRIVLISRGGLGGLGGTGGDGGSGGYGGGGGGGGSCGGGGEGGRPGGTGSKGNAGQTGPQGSAGTVSKIR